MEKMLTNLRHILAIELLCACQGIDLLTPLQTGTLAKKAVEKIRAVSTKLAADRTLAPDLEAVSAVVARGEIAAVLH